jgi:hypothetical protein
LYLHFRRISTLFGPPFFWSLLAFSTFQHRLASFNLPKIPIFRIWLDRFQLFLVGHPDHFQFLLLARYQRWAAPRGVFLSHLQNTYTRFIAQTRRCIHGLTYTSFALASSLQFSLRYSLAPSLLCNIIRLYSNFLLVPTWPREENQRTTSVVLFLLLRSLIWLRFPYFVCLSLSQKLFASPGWKGSLALGRGFYHYCTKIKVFVRFFFGSIRASEREEKARGAYYIFSQSYTTRHYPFYIGFRLFSKSVTVLLRFVMSSVYGRDHVACAGHFPFVPS